ncbi:NADP-dependent oxidoreductase [Planococcus soli]|uniref:NADP-dependent oxidoreductase n=1 Tax=Planococcus soli TaxID=2666072 RepID=UPI00115D12EB|nr:NADP-dependent oxidoreductase [Planococcus soli]
MPENSNMQAAVFNQHGGPEVIQLSEVSIPEVGPDEVLIKVAATSYNPLDSAIRQGNIISPEFPFIPHSDVAGVIEKTGESVESLAVGQKVFSYLDISRDGAAAEYVVSKAKNIVSAPTNIPLQDAGSIPLAALTAWQALFQIGKLEKGQRVLITAAAGGVGSFAVQLAKWKGAYVIGSASENSFQKLKELGIDEIIDYKNEPVPEVLNEKVDLIFNVSPAKSDEVNTWLPLLNKGGMLVSALSPASKELAEQLEVNTKRMAVRSNADDLTQIVRLVDEGAVVPFITERFPLSEVRTVHELAGKTRGKVLIEVDSSI